MNLTTELPVTSIVFEKLSYAAGASMNHEYDLFEKFPDGSSLWRASVSGLGNARLQLHELTQKSENQFYAIDIFAGKILPLDREHDALRFLAPRKTRSRSNEKLA
jgi:hypothetical protein